MKHWLPILLAVIVAVPGLQRDKRGRIKRSSKAVKEFKIKTGFPKGRPGYIIDHVVALRCGGPDTPANMQWQTVAEAKAKDKTEKECGVKK